MSNALSNFRRKYPMYNDIPDADLAVRLLKKHPVYRDALGPVAATGAGGRPGASSQPIVPKGYRPSEVRAARPYSGDPSRWARAEGETPGPRRGYQEGGEVQAPFLNPPAGETGLSAPPERPLWQKALSPQIDWRYLGAALQRGAQGAWQGTTEAVQQARQIGDLRPLVFGAAPLNQRDVNLDEYYSQLAGRSPLIPEPTANLGVDLGRLAQNVITHRGGVGAPVPGFYSKLEKTLGEKMPTSAPTEQVLGMARGAVKAEEMENLAGALEGSSGVVSKPQVLEAVKAGVPQIQEVVKGEPKPPAQWREVQAGIWTSPDAPGFKIEVLPNGYFRTTTPGGIHDVTQNGADAQAKVEYYRRNAGENIEGPTRYGQYTLPGGTNYRELLLMGPGPGTPPLQWRRSIQTLNLTSRGGEQGAYHVWRAPDPTGQGNEAKIVLQPGRGYVLDMYRRGEPIQNAAYPTLEAAQRRAQESHAVEADYKSPHWNEPNVLAHVRFNDRMDAAGKKTLFLEELQSDWHQAGREHGYKNPEIAAQAESARKEYENAANDYRALEAKYGMDHAGAITYHANSQIGKPPIGLVPGADSQVSESFIVANHFAAAEKRMKAAEDKALQLGAQNAYAVPQAPFAKTWHELALKRMLTYAAEKGYDQLAWTTGAQQADRYNLAKQIQSVGYNPDLTTLFAKDTHGHQHTFEVTPEKLPEYVGKELAERLLGTPLKYDQVWGKTHSLTGVDLKIGGEGMKGFYDRIVPSFLNSYAKKWGAQVGETQLTRGEPRRGPGATVHALPITPAMRQEILSKGQPLYSVGGVGAALGLGQTPDNTPPPLLGLGGERK